MWCCVNLNPCLRVPSIRYFNSYNRKGILSIFMGEEHETQKTTLLGLKRGAFRDLDPVTSLSSLSCRPWSRQMNESLGSVLWIFLHTSYCLYPESFWNVISFYPTCQRLLSAARASSQVTSSVKSSWAPAVTDPGSDPFLHSLTLGFPPTWVTAICLRVPLSSNQNESSLKAGNQVWWITTEDSPETQGISFWNRELRDTSLSSCLCVCFLKEEGYFCPSIMSVDLNFLCSSIWTTDLTLTVLEGFVLFGLPEAWQSNTSQLSNPQTPQWEPHIHPL